MEVTLDPTLGLAPTLAIPADLRQVPAQRYQELHQRFCFARTYIATLYPEHREMLEIGRLWRHQTHQAAAVSRLQMENDRLRTRLEAEGIPLDFSDEEEEDDDDASSDDAPPPPPSSVRHFNPNTIVFLFDDSEVTPTYEEMCAIMGHHPEQDETPALPQGPRYDLTEVSALWPVYLSCGIDPDQGLPLEPFLNRVLSMDVNSWVYHCTVFMMIMGETTCWARYIALQVTNFNVHHQGCPMLLQAWALNKLSMIRPVPARSIPTYGPANFRTRCRGHFDFGDNSVIRWTCPWWRIRLVIAKSMNLNYVLYASLDCSMAYFLDRVNHQYGGVQHVPRVHYFESGPMMQSLLTNLADHWQNRNTLYMGQGVMHEIVTPEYADWFYS
ncbi:hypothetical protein JCGZ_08874 [Jatropha curcas]|uniref:Aminotransferase-like plant mobile domain-containing protein n=1 Tax=Jatropha curcas TaxID=180498 RepID=A0A067KK74_JATCU|nr:hypothetical protein JCGZ_08874 [Jatropha curcas]